MSADATTIVVERNGGFMQTFWCDLRYGARMLVKKPGFTFVAIITLALGIGANTAIFSVVNAVLLRPLPYPQAERIVQVWETDRATNFFQDPVSPYCFADWKEQSRGFEHLAAYEYEWYALTGSGEPERVVGAKVSSSFLSVLGVGPALGRDFHPEEETPGQHRVVLVGHGLWQRRLGADPKIIGQTITLSDETFTVIGVMPQGFQFPRSVELWSPLAIDRNRVTRGSHYLFAIGRLKPDVTLTATQTEMDAIARRLEEQYPSNNKDVGVNVVSLHEQLVGKVERRLWILLGAVGLVLLIACANVANLFLARAAARHKETAIRLTLGASRWRLVRQFLTESVLLAVLGGGLGVLLALWGIDLLVAANPGDLPRVREIALDRSVFGFTTLVSLVTGGIFGLAPALQATKPNLHDALKEGGRASTGGAGRQRLRSLFVVSEIALALVLSIGAGLLIQSFLRLQNVNPGFNAKNALTMHISLAEAKYGGPHQQTAYFQQVLERLEAIPGVEAVGAVNDLPFSGSRTGSSFSIPGRTQAPGERWAADFRQVSPGYFKAMRIPLLKGRTFSEADAKEAPGVVIINQAMARRFWPNEDPLGQRFELSSPQERKMYGGTVLREIVGIVGDIRHERLDGQLAPEMYVPYLQLPRSGMSLVVRGVGDSEKLIPAIRTAVYSVDRDQPIANLAMLERRLARSVATERLNTVLLGIFAALALVLAAVGIYGVMSYSVTQRTHEIGVRMALGAQAADVLKLVVGQGMVLALIGVSVGLASALALTRVLANLLFGVTATDPLTFAGISCLLVLVALAASYIPARRASRVDPMIAIRYE
jgi:putative ABC transport system permease protein